MNPQLFGTTRTSLAVYVGAAIRDERILATVKAAKQIRGGREKAR